MKFLNCRQHGRYRFINYNGHSGNGRSSADTTCSVLNVLIWTPAMAGLKKPGGVVHSQDNPARNLAVPTIGRPRIRSPAHPRTRALPNQARGSVSDRSHSHSAISVVLLLTLHGVPIFQCHGDFAGL